MTGNATGAARPRGNATHPVARAYSTVSGPLLPSTSQVIVPDGPVPVDKYSYRTVLNRDNLHLPMPNQRVLWKVSSVPQAVYLHGDEAIAKELTHWSLKEPIGFDMEWDPTFSKGRPENPVALIQLASRTRIALIQLPPNAALPSALDKLLSDPTVIKVGVNILGDAKKLLRDTNTQLAGGIDLSPFAYKVYPSDWEDHAGGSKASIGLARLTDKYLRLPMPKGRIQRSVWSTVPLQPKQQEYAANDAYAAIELLYIFLSGLDAMSVKPGPRPLEQWEKSLLGPKHNQYVYQLIRSHLPDILPSLPKPSFL